MMKVSAEVAALFRHAEKTPLLTPEERERGPTLNRAAIENLIPHRDPFLLLDEISALDFDAQTIAARYELKRAKAVLDGHFPTCAVWPGVMQVEAIGQAGCVWQANRAGESAASIAATHILGARFLSPVKPPGTVEIVARVIEEGLFLTVVGQCFQNEKLCCVAAVRALA